MLIAAVHSRIELQEHEDTAITWNAGPFWQILECPCCDGVIFREGYWDEHLYEDTGPEYKILYPSGPEHIRGLPMKISKAYEASQKVKLIDSNAFAVLLGRVLELVCIDKNAVGNSLFERLKDIADRGIMPQQLADMAHALRQLRNIGAHADLGELTNAEVPILEDLSIAILEYVYSAPALVELVQSKLDAFNKKS